MMPALIEMALVSGLVLACFAAARALSVRLGNPPWASPVLVAALVLGLGLAASGVPLARFDAAAMPLRWLLGPALVALALVIHGNLALLRRAPGPVLLAVTGGTMAGVASAWGLARLSGLDRMLVMALTTKTVSTPFAVVIARMGGASVALAAAVAVLTGVIGAVCVPILFDVLKIRGRAARGLGLGVSSHLVGTDWLTRRDPAAGAFAALAMVLTGVLAALFLPVLWPFLFG
jgi:putative effector of murein hydrolase